MFKKMEMSEWVQKVHSAPSEAAAKAFNGRSPGGVASYLGISRQAVHDAIKRDRMNAWRLTRDGKLTAILIPDHEVEYYRCTYLRKSA